MRKKKKQPTEFRAVGITCGIGSMLVGARLAGFTVLSNVEWRKYYHLKDDRGRNTFTENFPGAVFKHKIEEYTPQEVERIMEPDLAMGHPECGNFSQLGMSVKGKAERLLDPGDIPLFVDLVAKIRPRFFVMDDLPKSFGAFSMEEYSKRLPDYDLFPEWVSNWGYGNVQKYRNRMFMIGSLKSEKFVFRPGETVAAGRSLEAVTAGLGEPGKSNYPNHDPYDLDALAGRNLGMRSLADRPTWREVAEFARANWKTGESMTYHAKDGTIKRKPGYKIEHWDDRGVSVQCGQAYKLHPKRFTPLTIRERARIQGFPDDFIFYGTKLDERGRFHLDQNLWMTKQTGKAMPVQFCEYVARQVLAHIRGEEFQCSDARILRSNDDIDQAKYTYCRTVGYADQEGACRSCWLSKHCDLRHGKYGIGEPALAPRQRVRPAEEGEVEEVEEGETEVVTRKPPRKTKQIFTSPPTGGKLRTSGGRRFAPRGDFKDVKF